MAKTQTNRRGRYIDTGHYHRVTKWDRLLSGMKRLMGSGIPSKVNDAASCEVGVPFTYQRVAPISWLRNVFNAPNLKGIWTKDGTRL